jgi:hypothetical protein
MYRAIQPHTVYQVVMQPDISKKNRFRWLSRSHHKLFEAQSPVWCWPINATHSTDSEQRQLLQSPDTIPVGC